MDSLLLWIGRLAGCAGVFVTAAAMITRVTGSWSLGGFQVGTVLLAGMAMMILACLAYCANLAERPRP